MKDRIWRLLSRTCVFRLCYKGWCNCSCNTLAFPVSIGCVCVRWKVLTFVESFLDEFIIAIWILFSIFWPIGLLGYVASHFIQIPLSIQNCLCSLRQGCTLWFSLCANSFSAGVLLKRQLYRKTVINRQVELDYLILSRAGKKKKNPQQKYVQKRETNYRPSKSNSRVYS